MKYYIKRLFGMNYGQMLKVVKKVHLRSKKNSIIIFLDMISCSIKYKAGYMDYYVFNFENLTAYQRSTFITRGINNNYIKYLNDSTYYHNFDNKIEFNQIFNHYLNRDYLDLEHSDKEDFKLFCHKHSTFMAKPTNGLCGKGIEKITIDKSTDLDLLYEKLLENKQILIEQFVIQSDEMNRLFPNSVNTLRLVTANVKGKSTLLFRAIRIGNGNNVVDNFNHGGMYSVISEDGMITKPAIDKEGTIYEVHPVTNTKIVGFKIPYFEEAKKMVLEASKVIPEVGLVGWDISITNDGPVMIEGNQLPGYDIYQSKIHLNDDGTGSKLLFDKVIYHKD